MLERFSLAAGEIHRAMPEHAEDVVGLGRIAAAAGYHAVSAETPHHVAGENAFAATLHQHANAAPVLEHKSLDADVVQVSHSHERLGERRQREARAAVPHVFRPYVEQAGRAIQIPLSRSVERAQRVEQEEGLPRSRPHGPRIVCRV